MYEPTISESIEQLLSKWRTKGNRVTLTWDVLDYLERFNKYNYVLNNIK
jgi:hypothetical protein